MMFFFWSFWHFWDVSIEICRYKSTFPKNRLQVHWTRLAKKRRFFACFFFLSGQNGTRWERKRRRFFLRFVFFLNPESKTSSSSPSSSMTSTPDWRTNCNKVPSESRDDLEQPGTAWNSLEQSGTRKAEEVGVEVDAENFPFFLLFFFGVPKVKPLKPQKKKSSRCRNFRWNPLNRNQNDSLRRSHDFAPFFFRLRSDEKWKLWLAR